MMKRSMNDDNAVSPVVGVMLMLVVTIIIAAVVAAFAGGLGETAAVAPNTVLEFSMRAGPSTGISASGSSFAPNPDCVVLKVAGGDPLPSADIQIVTTYTIPDTFNGNPTTYAGKVIKHTLDGALTKNTDTWKKPVNPGEVFTPQVNGYYPTTSLAPGNGLVGAGTPRFGSCIFNSGFEYWFKDRSAFLGFDTTDYTSYGFQDGSIVHITVIHKPTGQTIYDKDVVVSW